MSPERKAELLQLAESRGMFLLYGPPRYVDYGDVLKFERSTEPTPATMAMLEFAEAAVLIERNRCAYLCEKAAERWPEHRVGLEDAEEEIRQEPRRTTARERMKGKR